MKAIIGAVELLLSSKKIWENMSIVYSSVQRTPLNFSIRDVTER